MAGKIVVSNETRTFKITQDPKGPPPRPVVLPATSPAPPPQQQGKAPKRG